MSNTTTTQVPPGVQAFYDRNLLARAVPSDIHGRFGQARPIKTRNGTQIKFRRYSALTAATTPLTEGTTPSGSQLSVTDITATLAQYGDFVTITDMVDMTNQDAVLTEAGQVLGEQAGFTIDQIRRDVLVAGTNVTYANGASRVSVNTVLTGGMIKTAVRFLKRQNAKKVTEAMAAKTGVGTVGIRASFIGLIHPDTEATLKSITGYVPVNQYSSQMEILDDEVGSLDEVRFIASTNGKVFASGGATSGTNVISTDASHADVYATLIIAANAYGVCPLSGEAMRNIVKQMGSAGTADPLEQRATSGWKATTTTSILNDAWMMRLEHANTSALS